MSIPALRCKEVPPWVSLPLQHPHMHCPCVTKAVMLLLVIRGSVPPGARFDPFGPVPPGGTRGDTRSGRFAGSVNNVLFQGRGTPYI